MEWSVLSLNDRSLIRIIIVPCLTYLPDCKQGVYCRIRYSISWWHGLVALFVVARLRVAMYFVYDNLCVVRFGEFGKVDFFFGCCVCVYVFCCFCIFRSCELFAVGLN